jgi:uncharacterized protein (TIRG00374 family)
MKRNVWIGIIVSVILVGAIAWSVDLRESFRAMAAADFRWVISALVVLGVSMGLRAWRWRFIMEPVKLISTLRLFSAMMIGFMGNMLLPARIGEFIRAYVVGRSQRVSTSASLATIVVERMLDGFTLLAFLVFTIILITFPAESESLTRHIRTAGWLAFCLYTVVLVFCIFLRIYGEPTRRLLLKVLFFLPERWREGLGRLLDAFVHGLEVVKGGWHLVPIMGLSLAAWSLQSVSNWMILMAFHLDLTLGAAFFLVAIQAFGVMIPSSPGFIGTYHAATILGLAAFGISREVALSVSIVMHLLFFIPVSLAGFACLWVENLSFSEITHAPEEAQPEAAGMEG